MILLLSLYDDSIDMFYSVFMCNGYYIFTWPTLVDLLILLILLILFNLNFYIKLPASVNTLFGFKTKYIHISGGYL